MKTRFKSVPIFLIAALISGPAFAQGADEETLVLRIGGNKVDVLENVPSPKTHQAIITAYYTQIPEASRAELAELWQQMKRRTEDYQVAFRSGDTAELNETLDDLGLYWATIRTVHAREFTEAAIAAIESAYAGIFPFIRDPQ